jgi:hypothetical protein
LDTLSSATHRWARLARTLLVLGLLALCSGAEPARAKLFHSQEEALALAFPDADRITKKVHILSDGEVTAIESMARSHVETRLVAIYTAYRDGELVGYAHIDVHTVRTKPEGFMVVLRPDGSVDDVEILAFYEPLEYLPTSSWYDRFTGKAREDRLRVGRDVDAVTGATLSARAATEGVRRMLAYYQVLLGPGGSGLES